MPDADKLYAILELIANSVARVLPGRHRWSRLAARLEKLGLDPVEARELKLAAELARVVKVPVTRAEARWLLAQDDMLRLLELRRHAGLLIRYEQDQYVYAGSASRWSRNLERWVTILLAILLIGVTAPLGALTVMAIGYLGISMGKAGTAAVAPYAYVNIAILLASFLSSGTVFFFSVRAIESGTLARKLVERANLNETARDVKNELSAINHVADVADVVPAQIAKN